MKAIWASLELNRSYAAECSGLGWKKMLINTANPEKNYSTCATPHMLIKKLLQNSDTPSAQEETVSERQEQEGPTQRQSAA